MPGFMPGIHVFSVKPNEDVDGRVKPGHDDSLHGSGLACSLPIR
jgi:hypothetical protein